jgi:hypothetical protein
LVQTRNPRRTPSSQSATESITRDMTQGSTAINAPIPHFARQGFDNQMTSRPHLLVGRCV